MPVQFFVYDRRDEGKEVDAKRSKEELKVDVVGELT